jgi:hypothetical protein
MRRYMILIAIMLIAVIAPASIYALQNDLFNITENMPEAIALAYLKVAPTFKFDGIKGSVKVVESWQAQTFAYPSFWQVTIEFDSKHAGYGDRTGQLLADVITHHTIRIHVTEGKVSMAIIDNKWDELNQKPIPSNHTQEEAEQIVLEWLYGCPTFSFDGVPETVKVLKIDTLRMPYAWQVNIGFTCNYPGYGDRTGNVMLGKAQEHIIIITVIEGKVTRAIIDDVWDETTQKMLGSSTDEIVSSEFARDIAIAYLINTYKLNESLPRVWVIEESSPRLLGYCSLTYISDPWYIVVEYPVVWKPTYTVTVNHKGGEAFTWKGTVDQNRSVDELETSLHVRVEFRLVVNGIRELNVLVPVNVIDGLTREEAEQIAEETFVQVMGEKAMHRLDKLTLNENSMEAHYTWGVDERDMGHVFDMIGDIASRTITVTHCK